MPLKINSIPTKPKNINSIRKHILNISVTVFATFVAFTAFASPRSGTRTNYSARATNMRRVVGFLLKKGRCWESYQNESTRGPSRRSGQAEGRYSKRFTNRYPSWPTLVTTAHYKSRLGDQLMQGDQFADDEARDVMCQLPKEMKLPWYMCARMLKPAYGLDDAPRKW